jgi:PiT family inorganic phosphate transporter
MLLPFVPTLLWLLLLIILAIAFYMAWNIGANDLANSMASAVGARAITLKQAIIFGGILAFIGAVFVGSHVTETIRKGIIDPSMIGDAKIIGIGAASALLGASIWITIATWKALPISTTHSIVGGMIGFGLIAGGIHVVNWAKIGSIAASWLLSPIVGGILSYFVFKSLTAFILDRKHPIDAAKRICPVFIGLTFFIMALSIFLKTPLGDKLQLTDGQSVLIALGVAVSAGTIGGLIVLRFIAIKHPAPHDLDAIYHTVEEIFRRLQIMTSCYVAFALGANDVANAIGPASAAYTVITTGGIGKEVAVPYYLLVLGGFGIAIGMATWGYRVVKTIGTKITKLTNTRGFSIDFGGATSVLIASKLGMPVSTTHAVVGAVIGVGLSRGLDAVDLSIIKKIVYSWLITLPVAATTTCGIFLFITSII